MDAAADPPAARLLAPADLADLVGLQAAVAAGLPAGFLYPRTEGELRAYLDGTRGAAYGIGEAGALVAASLLRVPDEGRPNGGPRFRLVPEEDWPLRACFLQNAMVLPEARGRGYQRALLGARLAHAASAGMGWACAGIDLRNQVSWANLLAGGMVIADIRLDLGHPVIGLLGPLGRVLPSSDPTSRRSVSPRDDVQHRRVLRDGYVGVRLAPDGSVTYQQLPPEFPQARLRT